jgi:mono/diheme cytochrome c family protein
MEELDIMKARWIVVLSVLVVTTSAAGAESLRGRESYMRYCSACHGEAADGKGPVANAMKPRPPALTKLRSRFGRPLRTRFVAYVMGDAMPRAHGTSDMPVWGEVLGTPDGDDGEAVGLIWQIADYLDSIQSR